MRRTALVVVLAAVILGVIVGPSSAGPAAVEAPVVEQQQQLDTNATESDESQDVVAPGERFAGVVDVQEAEVEGEVEHRAFGISVAKAATADAKAGVVKAEVGSVEARLDRLRDRKRTLDRARENGTISEGRYRAEIAAVVARTATLRRLANASEAEAQGLPAAVLEQHGINVSAIRTLQRNASELAGPEVAAIARTIAGPRGAGLGVGPPADRPTGSGPADAANHTGPPGNGGGSAGAMNASDANTTAAGAGGPADDPDRGGSGGDRGPPNRGDGA